MRSYWSTFLPKNWAHYFPILILIGLVFNFPQLGNFSLTIDDEFSALRSSPENHTGSGKTAWASQGRWLAGEIEPVLASNIASPYWPVLIFLIGQISAFYLIIRFYRERLKKTDIYIFLTIIAAPTSLFLSEFYANIALSGAGVVLATLSARLIVAADKASSRSRFTLPYLAGVVLGTLALSLYQSYLFLFLLLCVAFRMLPTATTNKDESRGFRQTIIPLLRTARDTAACFAAYTLTDFCLKNYIYKVQASYTDSFLRLDLLTAHPLHFIVKTAHHALGILFGSSDVYGAPVYCFGLLILISLLAINKDLFSNRRPLFKTNISLFLVLAAPFVLTGFAAGSLPVRSYVAYPFALGLLVFHAIESLPQARSWLLVSLGLASFQSINLTSYMQASVSIAQTRDSQVANDIYMAIAAKIPDFDRNKVHVIDVYGTMPYRTPYIPANDVGTSFFNWRYRSANRIAGYLNVMGYGRFEAAPEAIAKKLTKNLEQLPVWPHPQSIALVDEIICIRLGPEPDLRHY